MVSSPLRFTNFSLPDSQLFQITVCQIFHPCLVYDGIFHPRGNYFFLPGLIWTLTLASCLSGYEMTPSVGVRGTMVGGWGVCFGQFQLNLFGTELRADETLAGPCMALCLQILLILRLLLKVPATTLTDPSADGLESLEMIETGPNGFLINGSNY